jgi:hypothetical protein
MGVVSGAPSLSLSLDPSLSLLCIQNTLSLVVHLKRNIGFFFKSKRRRKGSLQYVKSQMYGWSMDLDVVVVGLMLFL